MESGIIIALALGAASFTLFILLVQLLKHIFIIELSDTACLIIGVITAVLLYIKRNFFIMGNPLTAGATWGVVLGMLWSIRHTMLMNNLLQTIISFRFIFWAAATYAGMYLKGLTAGPWQEHAARNTPWILPILFLLVAAVYILGTVLVLFPAQYLNKIMKKNYFHMRRKVPFIRRFCIQALGFLLVAISSTLIQKAISYFGSLIS